MLPHQHVRLSGICPDDADEARTRLREANRDNPSGESEDRWARVVVWLPDQDRVEQTNGHERTARHDVRRPPPRATAALRPDDDRVGHASGHGIWNVNCAHGAPVRAD